MQGAWFPYLCMGKIKAAGSVGVGKKIWQRSDTIFTHDCCAYARQALSVYGREREGAQDMRRRKTLEEAKGVDHACSHVLTPPEVWFACNPHMGVWNGSCYR